LLKEEQGLFHLRLSGVTWGDREKIKEFGFGAPKAFCCDPNREGIEFTAAVNAVVIAAQPICIVSDYKAVPHRVATMAISDRSLLARTLLLPDAERFDGSLFLSLRCWRLTEFK
jgi:hypothetical protein